MLLADLGAEVIKIETPGQGDPFRGWGHHAYSPTFCSLNRNKRSLSLNVREPEGKEIFLRLARDSDVIIENNRPGSLDRMGIGYEAVRAINPRIVYCAISGYGSDGPYRDRPGYDTIGQAMGGLLSVLSERDTPKGVGASLSDLLTGMYACYAVQGALIAQQRTGLGQKVETSLLQATIAFGAENAVRYLATGMIPPIGTRGCTWRRCMRSRQRTASPSSFISPRRKNSGIASSRRSTFRGSRRIPASSPRKCG
jgi:crotonobetainyl-CoA:carnitine CoA-transferase CaiB-like acyl-CoA transferase